MDLTDDDDSIQINFITSVRVGYTAVPHDITLLTISLPKVQNIPGKVNR